jgi:TetR/AcrR family transcriptional regulator
MQMSIAERKEREKEQRRSDIIDAAERLFFTKSYDEVAMSDIAVNVELNKATLYLYFKNKESLYFAVITRGLVLMRDMFIKAADGKLNGRDKLLALTKAFFAFCHGHPEYYLLMCEARTRRFDMAQVADAMLQMTIAREIIGSLCEAVEQGTVDGSMQGGLDPTETAAFVMANCESAVRPSIEIRWDLGTKKISPGRYLEHSISMMMSALTGQRMAHEQMAKYYAEFLGESGAGLW